MSTASNSRRECVSLDLNKTFSTFRIVGACKRGLTNKSCHLGHPRNHDTLCEFVWTFSRCAITDQGVWICSKEVSRSVRVRIAFTVYEYVQKMCSSKCVK